VPLQAGPESAAEGCESHTYTCLALPRLSFDQAGAPEGRGGNQAMPTL